MLSDDEVKAAPENIKLADTKPKAGEFKYTLSVSPLDCMGCGECVTVCPVKAIEMVPQEQEADEQQVFDYLVANVSKKPGVPADTTVKGSQFNQPLLEFSAVQDVQKLHMQGLLHSCSANRCMCLMQQVVLQSGEVLQLHRRIQ